MSDICNFEAATLMAEDLPSIADDILTPDDLEEYLSSKFPGEGEVPATNQTSITNARDSSVAAGMEFLSRDVPTHQVEISPGFDLAECCARRRVEPPRYPISSQKNILMGLCCTAVTINTNAEYADTELPIYIKANIVGKLELKSVEALGYAVFHKVTKAIFGKAVGGTDRDARLRYIKRMTAALFTACMKAGFDEQACLKKWFGDASIRDDMKEYFLEHFDASESNRTDIPEKLEFWARNDQLKQCSKGVVRRMDKEWKALPLTMKRVVQRNVTTPDTDTTVQLFQVNDTCLTDFIQATGDKKTRCKFNSSKGYVMDQKVSFAETQYGPRLKDRYMKIWDAFIAASKDNFIMDSKMHYKDMFQRWYDKQSPPTGSDGPSHLRAVFLRLQEECFVKNANAFGNDLLTHYYERYGCSKSSSRVAKSLLSKDTGKDHLGASDQWKLQPEIPSNASHRALDSDSDAGAAA